MKKVILSLVLVSAFAVSFVACGEKAEEAPVEEAVEEVEAPVEEAPAAEVEVPAEEAAAPAEEAPVAAE